MRSLIYNPITGIIDGILTASTEALMDIQSEGLAPLMIYKIKDSDVPHEITELIYMDITVMPPVLKNQENLLAEFDKLSVTADGVDIATITGLPIPCTVNIDGNSYDVPNGTFEFTAIAIGTYEVSVDEIAYLRKDWVINAN
tara:strand:- start:483 stop:908 length:426 start_codon:yes stop_codon:yes gene_type:complete